MTKGKDRPIWYCLDNGIIIEGNGTIIDYRKSQMKEVVFLAKQFAKEQGLPLIQAHLVENLVNIKLQAVREAKRTCYIQSEIRNIHQWLSTHFPDMISKLNFGRTDIVAQPAGDAFAIGECLIVHYRCITLDRRNPHSRINNSCFQYFPLETSNHSNQQFVEIPSRIVRSYSPLISCSKLPSETIIKSEQGNIAVQPGGKYRKVNIKKTEYSPKLWMTPLKYTHGYNKDIFVKLPKRTEPYPVLGLMAEVHENVRELQEQIERLSETQSSPSIFTGIAFAIGSLLESAGNGTSKVINALGTSIKSAAEGVGTLSKDIISSSGVALADTIKAGGSAIKDVEEGGADIIQSIFGGLPELIISAIVLLIVITLLFIYRRRLIKLCTRQKNTATLEPLYHDLQTVTTPRTETTNENVGDSLEMAPLTSTTSAITDDTIYQISKSPNALRKLTNQLHAKTTAP